MIHHTTFLSLPLTILLLYCTLTLAQTPAPAGPTNITGILEKAGQFTTLLRLFETTQLGNQINAQLNNSDDNRGLTVFAPPDGAFAALPAGTLNSLSDQQKVALVQFHVLPVYLSMSQFQTATNPLRTQAGDTVAGEFPLNVTTDGNRVNVSTGVDEAAVGNAVYSDGRLAVYQVDKVLLPLKLFGAPAPAPAPTKTMDARKKRKDASADGPTDDGGAPVDSSGVVTAARGVLGFGFAVLTAVYL